MTPVIGNLYQATNWVDLLIQPSEGKLELRSRRPGELFIYLGPRTVGIFTYYSFSDSSGQTCLFHAYEAINLVLVSEGK